MDVRVHLTQDDREVRVPSGTLLIDAIRSAGMPLASACGADGVCGRCAVEIVRGARALASETASERRAKERNRVDPRFRLACRVALRSDVAVSTPYW